MIAVIAGSLTMSLGVIALYVATRGDDRFPVQAIRFIVTCVVCFGLYRRIPAARWFAVISFSIGSVTGFSSGVFWMAFVYLVFAVTLAFEPNVNAFFHAPRRRQ